MRLDQERSAIGRREFLVAFTGLCTVALHRVMADTPSPAAGSTNSFDEALPAWPDSARAIVRDALSKPVASGRINADAVRALTEMQKSGVEKLMVEILPVARLHARPPLSNFRVGAVALGASGALYLGANIEIPENGLNAAVHAEQSAVANAFGHEEQGIRAIAVTAAPCGHCRQFLNEITGGSAIRVIVSGQTVRTLADLLPASFGPEDLGIKEGLFSTPARPLRLLPAASDALAVAGLNAATRAYAPHTKALSGCAVQTKSGRVFTGSYLENAAFNPSLPPLQSALVNVAFGGEDFASITRVALVEMRGATISHRSATESALRAIAPKARIGLFLCESTG